MSEARATTVDETEIGSYFVANYPPFSVWTADAVAGEALPALSFSAARRAARLVPARALLPQAVSLLLLPRVYRQERAGSGGVPRRHGAGMGALQHLPRDQRTAAELRVLWRRHAVVSVGPPAQRTRAPAHGRHALDIGRRRSPSNANPERSPSQSSRRSGNWE